MRTTNGDGTYGNNQRCKDCTAPMVFPVNTPGYSTQQAPTADSYDEISGHVKAGLIYVAAGMRGRDNGYDASGTPTYSGGAPWMKQVISKASSPNRIFSVWQQTNEKRTSLRKVLQDSKLH